MHDLVENKAEEYDSILIIRMEVTAITSKFAAMFQRLGFVRIWQQIWSAVVSNMDKLAQL